MAYLLYQKILYHVHACEKIDFLKGPRPEEPFENQIKKTISIRKFIEYGRMPTRFKRNIFQTVLWKRDFFYAMSEKHFLLISIKCYLWNIISIFAKHQLFLSNRNINLIYVLLTLRAFTSSSCPFTNSSIPCCLTNMAFPVCSLTRPSSQKTGI